MSSQNSAALAFRSINRPPIWPAPRLASQGERVRASQAPTPIFESRAARYLFVVLRLVLGVFFLQHVMRIVFGYEPSDPTQLFGLPPGISAPGLVWDTVLGLALLYGAWVRPAAIAGAATLSIAMAQAFSGVPSSSFGWQFPVLWIVALLALALAWDGRMTRLRKPAFYRAGRRP